jgi:hypothetical protein
MYRHLAMRGRVKPGWWRGIGPGRCSSAPTGRRHRLPEPTQPPIRGSDNTWHTASAVSAFARLTWSRRRLRRRRPRHHAAACLFIQRTSSASAPVQTQCPADREVNDGRRRFLRGLLEVIDEERVVTLRGRAELVIPHRAGVELREERPAARAPDRAHCRNSSTNAFSPSPISVTPRMWHLPGKQTSTARARCGPCPAPAGRRPEDLPARRASGSSK